MTVMARTTKAAGGASLGDAGNVTGHCFGCDYYASVKTPATTTRVVDGIETKVCDECAKWYDYFSAETSGVEGA